MLKDTHLVIICVTTITICALFKLGEPSKDIILNAFAGMFGLVTGYAIRGAVDKLKGRRGNDGPSVEDEGEILG